MQKRGDALAKAVRRGVDFVVGRTTALRSRPNRPWRTFFEEIEYGDDAEDYPFPSNSTSGRPLPGGLDAFAHPTREPPEREHDERARRQQNERIGKPFRDFRRYCGDQIADHETSPWAVDTP